MSKRVLIGCLLGGMTLVTALAVGQQDAATGVAASSPFAVDNSENGALLLEVNTGRTWILSRSVDPRRSPVWLPLERLETEEDAAKWRAEEQARAEQADRRQQAAALRKKRDELVQRTIVPANSPHIQQLEAQLRELEAAPDNR